MAPSAAEDGGGVGAARTMRKTSASTAAAIARRRYKAGPSSGTLPLSAEAAAHLRVRPRTVQAPRPGADGGAHGTRRATCGRRRGAGRRARYFFAAILAVAKSLMMAASVS